MIRRTGVGRGDIVLIFNKKFDNWTTTDTISPAKSTINGRPVNVIKISDVQIRGKKQKLDIYEILNVANFTEDESE